MMIFSMSAVGGRQDGGGFVVRCSKLAELGTLDLPPIVRPLRWPQKNRLTRPASVTRPARVDRLEPEDFACA